MKNEIDHSARLAEISRELAETWADLAKTGGSSTPMLTDMQWLFYRVEQLQKTIADLRKPAPQPPVSGPRIWKGDAVTTPHWYWTDGTWSYYEVAFLCFGEIFVPGDQPKPAEPLTVDESTLPEVSEIDWL